MTLSLAQECISRIAIEYGYTIPNLSRCKAIMGEYVEAIGEAITNRLQHPDLFWFILGHLEMMEETV
jgi:hypothetical protein